MNRASPGPKVGIVIVAFEDLETLRKCLISVKAGTYADYRIIVIDNSLSDIVHQELSGKGDVDYYRPGRNIGFSKACNLGIARSMEWNAGYTLLLNPDTELDRHCLEALVKAVQALPNAGIVAGKIHYSADPGRLWYAGGRLSYLTGVGKHFQCERAGEGEALREVSYATGCCMLIPNPVLRETGFLSEKIFMYLDDAEFCMRLRKLGYKIYYNPKAVLAHDVGPGMNRVNYPDYYLYFSLRNKPFVANGRVYGFYLHIITVILAVIKLTVYGFSPGVLMRGKKILAILWGAWDSFSDESREEKRFPRLFKRG